MKFCAMVQFPAPGRAQWTLTQVKRDDGKGFTGYGLEADSWDEAIRKLPKLYRDARAGADKDIAELFTGDSDPEFVLLSCDDPREHRTIKWSDVCAR